MTKNQKFNCNFLIHSASFLAATVGFGITHFPLADNALIVPIQATMIVALGKIFDKRIVDSVGTGILLGTAGTFFGRAISQILTFWNPEIGSLINALTALLITETIGWLMVNKFYNDILE